MIKIKPGFLSSEGIMQVIVLIVFLLNAVFGIGVTEAEASDIVKSVEKIAVAAVAIVTMVKYIAERSKLKKAKVDSDFQLKMAGKE